MDNKWTVALAAAGVVSAACVGLAEESHPVNTLLPATTLSGYVDTAAIWHFNSGYNTVGGQVPVQAVANRFASTGSDRQDGFNVNAVKIALEKPLDEGTWSAGYKVETLFGPDANAIPGTLINPNSGNTIGVALKQAYVALRAPVGNGIDIKVGQFDPIIGYEVYDSYANPNFSRSLGFFLEPISHTGVLASYQFTDVIGVAGGVANTHFGNIYQKTSVESDKSYMGSITIKAPDSWGWIKGSSLYAGVVGGADAGNNPNTGKSFTTGSRPVNLYLGASLSTPIKDLSWGLSYDYLFNPYNSAVTTVPAALFNKSSYANAFAGYVSYQVTEKFKVNGRGEYATSSGGVFLPGGVNDEKVFGVTVTGDYTLWANVVTRAELRWDRDVGGALPLGGYPFNGRRNDFSLLANIIYKF